MFHMPARTALPNELLYSIAPHLDPITDRSSLLSLLCVSEAAWDAAVRVLYCHLLLDTDKVAKLLQRGRHISERTRRALTFTKSLEIVTPLRHSELYLLWEAAEAAQVPETPLFPRAETVRLVDRVDMTDSWDNPIPPLRPREDVRVFNCPDICLNGYQAHLQSLLFPRCSFRAATYHGWKGGFGLRDGLPRQWTSLRIFDVHWFLDNAPGSLRGWERRLNDEEDRRHVPAIQVYVTDSEHIYLEFFERAKHQEGWEPTPASRFQIEWYPPEKRRDCPPCTICGA